VQVKRCWAGTGAAKIRERDKHTKHRQATSIQYIKEFGFRFHWLIGTFWICLYVSRQCLCLRICVVVIIYKYKKNTSFRLISTDFAALIIYAL